MGATPDIAKIAASLTEAQRRAVLTGSVRYGSGYWPLYNALSRKGLLSTVFGGDALSPLGVAVRAHLEATTHD